MILFFFLKINFLFYFQFHLSLEENSIKYNQKSTMMDASFEALHMAPEVKSVPVSIPIFCSQINCSAV